MSSSYTEEWVVGPENTNFYTRRYDAGSPKALIVFLHGFNDHLARYEHVFEACLAHGISVFSFDQRGFGQTVLNTTHRSPKAAYGLSTRAQQLTDLEHFLTKESSRVGGPEGNVPVFLMGQSMGGGLVLDFVTRTSGKPSKTTIASLSGVIGLSPLLRQAHPANKFIRVMGGFTARLLPSAKYPAEVPAADLSTDSDVGKRAQADPLIKNWGTLKFIDDMLKSGETVLERNYAHWPVDLPLLLIHGNDDNVTSFAASQEFYALMPAKDKTFTPYAGCFHEVHNEPKAWEKEKAQILSWVDAHVGKAAIAAKL